MSTSPLGLNDNNTHAGRYKIMCEERYVITDRVMYAVLCVCVCACAWTRQSAQDAVFLDDGINTCMKFYFWRRERLGLGLPGC